MFDLPPDLPRLRVLETYIRLQLRLIEQAITAAETAEAARKRPPRPRGEGHRPAPDWVVTLGIGARREAVEVHSGACPMRGKHHRAVTRDQAVEALSRGVAACAHCRPDTELGLDV